MQLSTVYLSWVVRLYVLQSLLCAGVCRHSGSQAGNPVSPTCVLVSIIQAL